MKIVKWQALLGCVVSGLMVWMGGMARGQKQTPPQTYPQIVRLSYVEGDVRLARGPAGEKATGDEWEKAAADVPVYDGFTLATGADGRAEIEFEDTSHVYLGENSVLSFTDISATGGVPHTELALVSGVMTLDARTMLPGDGFEIRTPANSFSTRYPAKPFVRLNSYLDAMELTPIVHAQTLQMSPWPVAWEARKTMVIEGGKHTAQLTPPGPNAFAAWDAWVLARSEAHTDAMNTAMKAAGLNAPVPGLTEIAAQGSFFDCAPYGKCWEPKDGWDKGGAGDGASESNAAAEPAAAPASPAVVHQQAAGAQMMPNAQPCSAVDPSQCIVEDEYFPCSPLAMRDFYERDPATGRLKLIFTDATVGYSGYPHPYLWGVCHTGGWVRWHKRYVWVALRYGNKPRRRELCQPWRAAEQRIQQRSIAVIFRSERGSAFQRACFQRTERAGERAERPQRRRSPLGEL